MLHGRRPEGAPTSYIVTIAGDRCTNTSAARGLLVANRQVYDEALPLLYGPKRFDFAEVGSVVPWLMLRSERARGWVRHVGLRVDVGVVRWTGTREVWEQWSTLCRYLARSLRLKTLAVELVSSRGAVRCEGFHEDVWAKLLCEITGLDVLTIETKKENIVVDDNSFAFMKAKIQKPQPGAAASRLLSLPPEVRWRTYECLLVSKIPGRFNISFEEKDPNPVLKCRRS